MKSIAALFLFAAACSAAAPMGLKITAKIQIGGEGGWDYASVDSAARRAYVSHATKVEVVDLDAQKVVGEIPDTPGVHGIALAPALNRGFVSNGRGNNVTIFDLKTLKTIAQVATGQNPDAIVYDAASKRVFTFNGRSKDATVIEASSGKVEATIPLQGKPEFPAADGKGKLWVNIEDTNEIAEIDTLKLVVNKRYALTGCDEPSGLALNASGPRLFSVCGNKVMVVSDPVAGKVVATLPIGSGSDGAGFDAATGRAFSSNGEGTLTVVERVAGKYVVTGTVETMRGARTMVVDQQTHKIYLPAARFGPAPAPVAGQPARRPTAEPGSFMLLVVSEQ